jgi:nitroreductase
MIAWTMPDALELLTTRRSFKAVELAGPVPSATEIDTLLTVASRVPDHGKLAPWRFIVFEGEARRSAGEAIAAAFRAKYPDARAEHIEAERERLVRSPLVIAVVSRAGPHVKIPEWEQVLSAGAAAMSLVLAAHALGHGANWITEWYAYDRGVLDALGLAPHERIAGFIHIGRPPLFATSREISVCARLRGGAERTRTACQARSLSNESLIHPIHEVAALWREGEPFRWRFL